MRNENTTIPFNRCISDRIQLNPNQVAIRTISIPFLYRQSDQIARPINIGPLNKMSANPPCQPYSEKIGSDNNLGAKVTSTTYAAYISIVLYR